MESVSFNVDVQCFKFFSLLQVRQMLHVRVPSNNLNSEMLHMEHFSLIPIDESLTENTETWYILSKYYRQFEF